MGGYIYERFLETNARLAASLSESFFSSCCFWFSSLMPSASPDKYNVSFSAALKDLNARQHKYTINFVYDELEDFRVTKSIQKPECSRCHHAADRILSHQDDAGGG